MKSLLRTILGMLVVIVCIKVLMLLAVLCYVGFYNHDLFNSKPKNPLDVIEDKIEKVEQKEKILTPTEKELEKKSTEKDWEEVDKDTDK